MAKALHALGHAALDQRQDYSDAHNLCEDSAQHFRAVGEPWGLGWSLNCLATSARGIVDDEAAWQLYDEVRQIFTNLGDDDMVAHALGNLRPLAASHGDFVRVRAMLDESVALRGEVDM